MAVETVTSEPVSGDFPCYPGKIQGKTLEKAPHDFIFGQEVLLNQRLASNSLLHRTGNLTEMFRDRRDRICELPTLLKLSWSPSTWR
jgi:hypothetical protein